MFRFFKRKNRTPKSSKLKSSDWQNSSVHLNLLAYFLKPREARTYDKFQKWAEPLGEPVEVAIKRFLDLGMLQNADLVDCLVAAYSSTKLQGFLKERGLTQSGTKKIKAARLVEHDEQGAQKLVAGYYILVCSERGRVLADAYEKSEERRRKEALTQTEKELKEGNYQDAAMALASYEAECVFQRGMDISWDEYDTTMDEATLRYIFTRTPKIFSKRGWDKFENIRLIAGMIHLWGNANSAGLSCDFETIDAARSLTRHAHYLYQLDEANELDFKYVRVQTRNDSVVCTPCRKVARKGKYKLNEVPEFPLEDCEAESGCRCGIALTLS